MTLFNPIEITQSDRQRYQKPSLGLIYALSVPLVSGIYHLCLVDVGGFGLGGWLWIVMLLVGVAVFGLECALGKNDRVAFPVTPWLPFAGLLWASLLWCQGSGTYPIQMACQMTMPIFVGVAVSSYIQTERELRLLMFMFVINIALLVLGFLVELVMAGGHITEMGFRVGALTAMLPAAVCLTGTWKRRFSPWIGWGICLALAAVSGGRTATLAMLGMPILHPTFGRVVTKAAALGVTLLLFLALFFTPHFQDRFFHGGSGQLSDLTNGDINTSGRGEAWPLIWREAMKRPVLGAGVGTSGPFTDLVCNLGGHPHNDYLRVVFEVGFVGFGLFIAVVLWQSRDLLLRIRSSDGVVRHAFSAVWLAWLMFLFTSLTDNTLIYCAAYMNPMFALLGGAYGVHQRQRSTSREASDVLSTCGSTESEMLG
ncbi:MAG: O-antigen ligase family protein [Planctomycetes bacterium]|nr:O-antigen ligase family protein [Planctomycetota bacterium]